MWPFKSKISTEDTKDLKERVRELEKSFRRLEEEWTEVYHKFRTLQMRVAKQVQRLDQAPEGEDPQAAVSVTTSENEVGGLARTLTPRARQIQQQILERRNRLQKGAEE
jgi:predicted transcriptional regulator